MRQTRYTDERIAFAPRQVEGGTPVAEAIRQMGFQSGRSTVGRSLYGGFGICEPRPLRRLEDENRQMKMLVAVLAPDRHILQDVLSKKL